MKIVVISGWTFNLFGAEQTGRKSKVVVLMGGCKGEFHCIIKAGFHMLGKSRTIRDFTVSRPTQILPTNENSKSRTSPTVWDDQGQIGKIGSVSIFPMHPRFLRWSAIIQDI